jgi:hypothetical protein
MIGNYIFVRTKIHEVATEEKGGFGVSRIKCLPQQ